MKRIIIFVLLFLGALTAAYLGGSSPAQPPSPPAVLKHTKVGIVNLALLFSKYDKFKAMKQDFAKTVEPYNARKKELEKMILDWTEILKDPSGKLSEKNIVRGQKIIIDCKRQLEDLELECKTKFGKRTETDLADIWKEINDRVREYADQHGFHLILAYGDKEEDSSTVSNVKRKLGAIDAGGLTQVYAAGGVDISASVLTILNEAYRAAHPVENDADEGGER